MHQLLPWTLKVTRTTYLCYKYISILFSLQLLTCMDNVLFKNVCVQYMPYNMWTSEEQRCCTLQKIALSSFIIQGQRSRRSRCRTTGKLQHAKTACLFSAYSHCIDVRCFTNLNLIKICDIGWCSDNKMWCIIKL